MRIVRSACVTGLVATVLAGGMTGTATAAEAGELDSSWGQAGSSEPVAGIARQAVVDAQGRVYLAGDDGAVQRVVRYAPDGTFDWTFSGVALTRYYGNDDWSVALQPTGGEQRLLAVAGGRVHRFLPSGQPDAGFGTGGAAAAPGGVPVDLEVSADGRRIVQLNRTGLAGGYIASTPWPVMLPVGPYLDASGFALAAFDESGRVDASFGANGAVNVMGPAGWVCVVFCQGAGVRVLPHDVELLADGSVLVAGALEMPAAVGLAESFPREPFVLKLMPDGTPDSAFGEHGLLRGGALASLGGDAFPRAVTALAEQPGKGVVVALATGIADPWGVYDGPAEVRRLLSDGTLDTAFGAAGRQAVAEVRRADDLAVAHGGALVLFEDAFHPESPCGCTSPAVARLTPEGAVDVAFGHGGAIAPGEEAGVGTVGAGGGIYVPRSSSRYSDALMHVDRYLGAATGSGPGQGSAVRMTGSVKDARSGSGISGGTVDCGGTTATTGADGTYALDLTPGSHSCTASASGYQSVKQRVEVVAGMAPVDFGLRPRR